ncbi:MAG: hypothetical protein L3K18_05320 [Thermoplasmata archaeon]|nr:hypothetical protein [Thermoplasmata archaeon]MCI4356546.1 hypothetical protein [Thermoplasmata archaeon]
MRTKQVESVLRLDVVTLEPRPAVYLAYDGLGGLSQRPLLRDLVEELHRQGPNVLKDFLTALRKTHSGQVHVYFADYVSYGIGGGDATAEFFFGTFLVLHEAATASEPEQLVLQRPSGTERLSLDGVPN